MSSETLTATDYDTDPERFRTGRRVVQSYGLAGDVHGSVAARLRAEGLAPVLDLGCGDGALAEHLPSPPWLGLDASLTMLGGAARHGPVVRGDADRLPAADRSVGAVAALWVLYHLDQPTAAIAEARRVLRPGGLFTACTTARDDSPELVAHLGPPSVTSFDAEEAAYLVASVFGAGAVEVERWDAPLVRLPDRGAVTDYLRGRGIGAEIADDVAGAVAVPLTVTKRGCLVWARR